MNFLARFAWSLFCGEKNCHGSQGRASGANSRPQLRGRTLTRSSRARPGTARPAQQDLLHSHELSSAIEAPAIARHVSTVYRSRRCGGVGQGYGASLSASQRRFGRVTNYCMYCLGSTVPLAYLANPKMLACPLCCVQETCSDRPGRVGCLCAFTAVAPSTAPATAGTSTFAGGPPLRPHSVCHGHGNPALHLHASLRSRPVLLQRTA